MVTTSYPKGTMENTFTIVILSSMTYLLKYSMKLLNEEEEESVKHVVN